MLNVFNLLEFVKAWHKCCLFFECLYGCDVCHFFLDTAIDFLIPDS